MRRLVPIVAVVIAAVATTGAQAKEQSPAQLQRAGWDCLNPAPFFPANPNVHCFPPGQLEAVVAGTAVSAMIKAFATPDVNAEEGPFLGTEHMIRADHFHFQPCPDPPARRPARRNEQSTLDEYSHLLQAFGWDYWICHHFDSPW